jgi:hypothetical protein
MALFTTALGLYGGVLWSGELRGFVVHEMKVARCILYSVVSPVASPVALTGSGYCGVSSLQGAGVTLWAVPVVKLHLKPV